MNSSLFNLTTPVVFLVFNRPESTSKVFSTIRKARPTKLLVVADGPRFDHPEDIDRCTDVRRIVEQVDWPCEVLKNYSEKNLGCRIRVSSGLDWVFEQVEEAIILEDDCLPDESFFYFCQELLNIYRTNEKVMSISGSNLLENWKDGSQSYHFSCHVGVWGWATWRRAWQFYDVTMKEWSVPAVKKRVAGFIHDDCFFKIRSRDFDKVVKGMIDTWDYQWSYAHYRQEAFSVIPAVNLVSNIGFDQAATHTVDAGSCFANILARRCKVPLRTSTEFLRDLDFDFELTCKLLKSRPLLQKVLDYCRLIFGRT